ncbi:SwmB domain-containing protein [Flavicella sediminum]|uniref:SwmB domain-containing protein n=1 Tax=Flavicella sediminum TaxID=2585141 RepID=UPI00111DA767|nr:SwmB domain-containing protein [Flavicella sediminum]
MKNFKILNICFALLALVSCQNNDDYVAPDSLSDISWYTSIHPGSPFNKATGDHISFMDVSQGALSHEWRIEEGNKFLKTGFTTKDSLPLFVNPKLGLSTTDKTVHVLFMNEGVNKVCLKNTFSEPVTFQSADGPISAVQEGDVWVFERCFEVDVVAKEIMPSFKVLQDGVEIMTIAASDEPKNEDADSWPIIDVEVNKTLTFIDLTTIGNPNDRIWEIAGTPSMSNDSIAEVAFLQFGTTFNVGKLTSARVDPLPTQKNSKVIPLKVRVVSSSAPFEILSDITENQSEILSFQVAGTVDSGSLFGQNGNFTVNVSNSKSGFNQDIAVEAVGVNINDGTILELKLSEPIYNTDEITVSYAGGTIQSTDERLLADFSNKKVVTHFDTSLFASDSRFSFEVESSGDGGNTSGFWCQHLPSFLGTTDEVTAADGLRVVKYNVADYASAPGTSNFWGPGADLKALVPTPGAYRISIKFYRKAGATVSTIRTLTNPSWKVSFWDFSASNDDWITLENDIVTTAPLDKLDFQIRKSDNPGVTGEQTFYMDDIQIIPLELRP